MREQQTDRQTATQTDEGKTDRQTDSQPHR